MKRIIKFIDNAKKTKKHLFFRWFRKDENEVPVTYILQPISVNIPHFKSEEAEIRGEALTQWNAVRSKMHSALALAAGNILEEKAAQIYRRSGR